MTCKPCQQRKEKLLEEARKKNVSVFFKGNSSPAQIKIHGSLPIRCEAFQKWCVNAVYLKCDKKTCLIGTPAFDEIIEKFNKEQVEKSEE